MKNKVLALATLMAVMGISSLKAQLNVGSVAAPDASAMLQVTSTATPFKGFLPPTMTTTNRNAITSPATGLIVFNSTTNQIEVNTGTPAVPVWATAAAITNIYNSNGTLTGTRTVTQAGNSLNFGGGFVTITPQGLTNGFQFDYGNSLNNPRIYSADTIELQSSGNPYQFNLLPNGLIGIGTNAPTAKLHVVGTALISSLPSGATTDSVVTADASGNLHRRTATSLADLRIVGGGAFNNHITADAGVGSNGTNMGTGSSNVAIGTSSMSQNTTGANNVAVGINSLGQNTQGVNNIGVGPAALGQNKTSTDNVAIGANALYNNQGVNSNGNVAIGTNALYSNSGNNGLHIGIGLNALFANTTGYANIGIGYNALNKNTTASFNVALGTSSLEGVAPGDQNVAIGYQSGYFLSGAHNIALGVNALEGTSVGTPLAGSYNIGIGDKAGQGITTGGNNIAIGQNAQVQFATASNQMNIGGVIYGSNLAGATTYGNVAIGLGYFPNNGAYVLDIAGNGASSCVRSVGNILAPVFTVTSDSRLKKNIVPVKGALADVMKLKAVSYEKKATLTSTDYNNKEMGFIAQDLRKVFPTLVTEEKDGNKTLSVNYIAIIPVLTKAIQEQQAEIGELRKQNAAITAQLTQISDLKTAMAELRSQLNNVVATKAVSNNVVSK